MRCFCGRFLPLLLTKKTKKPFYKPYIIITNTRRCPISILLIICTYTIHHNTTLSGDDNITRVRPRAFRCPNNIFILFNNYLKAQRNSTRNCTQTIIDAQILFPTTTFLLCHRKTRRFRIIFLKQLLLSTKYKILFILYIRKT